MDTKWLKNSFIYLLILVAGIAMFFSLFPQGGGGRASSEKSISTYLADVTGGRVDKTEVEGDNVTVTPKGGGNKYTFRKEPGISLFDVLKNAGATPEQIAAANVEV